MLGITEVLENLYISGLESNASILSKGIRCVINISSECPIQELGPSIDYEKIPISDLPTTSIQPYFERLTDRIEQNLQQGKKTLVHCYVGRSRSASIILAYLMKYKKMSLREAFYYLRARRPIIGPNFGFIKQLITYEKSLFGTTTVSFVETSFGSVPDIYISIGKQAPIRQQPMTPLTTTIPIQITKKTSARPNSFIERSPTARISSSSLNPNLSPTNPYRPITSSINNSSFLHDQPRYNSTIIKSSFDSLREPFLSTRLNALRTGRYVPQFFNRYYLP